MSFLHPTSQMVSLLLPVLRLHCCDFRPSGELLNMIPEIAGSAKFLVHELQRKIQDAEVLLRRVCALLVSFYHHHPEWVPDSTLSIKNIYESKLEFKENMERLAGYACTCPPYYNQSLRCALSVCLGISFYLCVIRLVSHSAQSVVSLWIFMITPQEGE